VRPVNQLTTFPEWLAVQNGTTPPADARDFKARHRRPSTICLDHVCAIHGSESERGGPGSSIENPDYSSTGRRHAREITRATRPFTLDLV
jgi:hypothetical protein